MKKMLIAAMVVAGFASTALAKLPAPPAPTPEAQAKAEEAKLRTAHGARREAFQLCTSMQRVADRYLKEMKAKGKEIRPSETAACQDPGPFQAAAAAPAAAATKK